MLSGIHKGIDREMRGGCAQQGGDSPLPSSVLLRPCKAFELHGGCCPMRTVHMRWQG